jgi:hypothetical protein
MWSIATRQDGEGPVLNYEATRDAAVQAFAKAWHREPPSFCSIYLAASALRETQPLWPQRAWMAPVQGCPGAFPLQKKPRRSGA